MSISELLSKPTYEYDLYRQGIVIAKYPNGKQVLGKMVGKQFVPIKSK
jgi:hypothetical protein